MVARQKDSLVTHSAPRATKKSGELTGGNQVKYMSKNSNGGIFVIQKHAASNLHYDFRLEIDGVLVSWAVPKGPSTDPAVKHLAIKTNDHPIAYRNFEGVIAEGNYGSGVVMIWDVGTYTNIKIDKNGKVVSIKTSLKKGQIEVFLKGSVISGGYALVKLKGRSDDWLLVKIKDKYAHKPKNPTKTVIRSICTGRTMMQIKKDAKIKEKGA